MCPLFFCALRIYPHTALYEIAIEEGQVSRSESILEPVFYRPRSIETGEIVDMVEKRAKGHLNWVVGSGTRTMEKIVSRMYSRGHSGPLWEHLIR